jgi:hypothetical protein
MAENSWTFASRAVAIEGLDSNTAAWARAARAVLNVPELLAHSEKPSAPVIITVRDFERPDGGTIVQLVVSQHSAPVTELPEPDLHSAAPSTS